MVVGVEEGGVGHERFGKWGLGETSKGETKEAKHTVSSRRTIRVSPSVGGTVSVVSVVTASSIVTNAACRLLYCERGSDVHRHDPQW